MKKLAVLVFLCSWLSATAQEQSAGIPDSRLDTIFSNQQQNQWCWAASIQLILKHHGVDVSQRSIVQRAFQCDPDQPMANAPANVPVITGALNEWRTDSAGYSQIVSAVAWPADAVAPETLLHELEQGMPFLVGYQLQVPDPARGWITAGHIVLASGATYIPNPAGAAITSITVRDPSPEPRNVDARGRQVLRPPTWLGRPGNFYVFVRVRRPSEVDALNDLEIRNRRMPTLVAPNGQIANYSASLENTGDRVLHVKVFVPWSVVFQQGNSAFMMDDVKEVWILPGQTIAITGAFTAYRPRRVGGIRWSADFPDSNIADTRLSVTYSHSNPVIGSRDFNEQFKSLLSQIKLNFDEYRGESCPGPDSCTRWQSTNSLPGSTASYIDHPKDTSTFVYTAHYDPGDKPQATSREFQDTIRALLPRDQGWVESFASFSRESRQEHRVTWYKAKSKRSVSLSWSTDGRNGRSDFYLEFGRPARSTGPVGQFR